MKIIEITLDDYLDRLYYYMGATGHDYYNSREGVLNGLYEEYGRYVDLNLPIIPDEILLEIEDWYEDD